MDIMEGHPLIKKDHARKGINMEETLERLTTHMRPPKSGYVLIILLYLVMTMLLANNARTDGVMMILGNPVPTSSLMGVFSAIGNICIIFLVVFYRRTGYITSVCLLLLHFPMLLINFFLRHNPSVLPGLFTNLFTIIAITVLYINNYRIAKYQRRIRLQAVTDPLTGLPNRFACTELVDDLMNRKIRFVMVSVDLDNFKSINDTMGHEVGNRVLIEIARRWKALADSWGSDTIDFVTRLGGDEFAIVIRGHRFEKDIVNAINKYRDELEKTITIDDCDYYLTAGFGYAEYPLDTDAAGNSAPIMSCSDAALHELKRKGNGTGNGVLHFTPDLLASERVFEIERRVRTAIEEDSVICYLQPQYDMDHKLHGFEALARLKDEDGNFISPAEFIPVAERAGLVDKIDLSVFKKAAVFLSEVLKDKDSDLRISFNVSVRHLMKNSFIEEIRAMIDETGVAPDHLEIEITESVMIDSTEKALDRINEVRKMGITIAIDDFGTGYSSLSYLEKLPVDVLKIDKSFIDAMNTGDSSKKYVEMIISIGHVMDMKVLSEGVETEEQLDTLKGISCDYIQGYIWGRPMPVEEAAALV